MIAPRRRASDGWVGKLGMFWDFLDRRGVIQIAVLGVAIWMTWRVSIWAMGYAEESERPGIDIAAVIAAVTGPVTVFGGFIFKAYVDSLPRKGEK